MSKSVNSGYFNPFLKNIHFRRILLSAMLFLFSITGYHPASLASGLVTNGTPIENINLPPGVPDLSNPLTVLTVTVDYSIADGTTTNTIQAHVVDDSNNPVANAEVFFNWEGGLTVKIVTNANGDAFLQLSSNEVGMISVTAKVAGQSFQAPAYTTFVAYTPDVTVPSTRLEVVTTGATADGVATNSVKAIVTDEDGNPVPNQPVTFNIASGIGSFTTPITVNTDLNGEASISLTSTTAGDVGITAVVGVTPITNGSPATVQFVVDVPSVTAPQTLLQVVTTGSLADGTATNSVKAHITDANGNPVENATVTFVIASGTATLTGSITGSITVTTDANGDAVLQLTSTTAGTVTITADVGGAAIINGSPASVEFVADTPDVTVPTTHLEVVATGAVADGTATNTVKAVITDVNGNPAANQTVVFQFSSGTAAFTSSETVTTDANGEAIISLNSNTVGIVEIVAEVNGTAIVNGSPASVEFISDPPDVTVPTTLLEVVTTGSPADGTSINSVRAHITDINGNPASSQTVTFVVSGTATPTGLLTVLTDANGNAILQLTSTTVGTVTITADVNGTAIVNGNPASVEFVADAPDVAVPTTRLEVVTTGVLADGATTNSVKAVITDANGNPASNQTVTFQIITGTGTFTTPAVITTDASGEAIISLTGSTPGAVEIVAHVNGTEIINGSPATVYFIADPPDVTVATTMLESFTTGAVADGTGTNSVRAQITDANGNPVAGQTVVFSIASGTATSGSYSITTDADGHAVFFLTSTLANTVTVTAEVNGSVIINGSPASVLFVQDAPSVTVSTTFLETVNTGATADNIATNTVRAVITDENGNPVQGQTVKFTITSGTAAFIGSDELLTDINGEVIINLQSTVADTVQITATVNGIAIIKGSPAEVEFVAGPLDITNPNTILIIDSDSAKADGASTNILRAHIVDAYGNPVAGQTVTFVIASGTATPGGVLTVTTDANGDAVLTLSSSEVGQVAIRADVNGIPLSGGSATTVTFIAYADASQPATALFVIKDSAAADGTTANIVRAHVVDNNGNPMPDQEVVFTIASGNANILTPQPVITNANGDAIIQLVSNSAGIVTITATVENDPITNGSPAQVTFTAEGVWVPRVFTPNGDGVNDLIRPIINGNFTLQYFNIYNRWGNLVFTTNDANQGWDGRLKGIMQPNETYLWILQGTNMNNTRVQKRGMFSLVK